ncbi:MAG: hypothetical protein IT168_19040 [Bryobacterales bacterium]|nr:hypothetical protein [Bryobacterales bacterium]
MALLRVILLCLPLLLLRAPAYSQSAQLDASKAMFTVLAAINAAGYNDGLDSPSSHPIRKQIRAEIAKANPPSLLDIKDFMRQHRQENPTWELRQYISYSLLVTDPPEFAWRIKEYQLPPDVMALKEFAPILQKFYKEANIEDLWKRSQPAFEQMMARYQPPAIQAVTEVSAYLRSPTSGTYMGREFKVIVDVLGAPNQIHFRPYLDDYFLVVTHSAEPHFNDIRQAYLHYLLDPLVTKYSDKVDLKKAVGDYAQGAPYLPEQYKEDFLLLFTKCLIRAIEAHLAPVSKRAEMVEQAMSEGYVLTAHFDEQLTAYEKQEQAMRMYFLELVNTIDFKKEERRMERFEFSSRRVERKAKQMAAAPPPELSPVEKSLEEAEELYTKRDLDRASRIYTKVLSDTQQNPLQARAYYGLARIATLKRDPETAVKLFERVLQLDAAPTDKAWSLVYLGRLSMAAGEIPEATRRFQDAFNIPGASPKAREAARQALDQIAGKPSGR